MERRIKVMIIPLHTSFIFFFQLVLILSLPLANNGEGFRFRRYMATHQQIHVNIKEVYPMASNLPDCSHACGGCMPCRRVIVGFNKCAVESCPVIYRCICKGRYYHVPSSN